MPFTVSHAAAVLPFRKLNLIWSAFIIGSMAPDFPYILGTTEYRSMGHEYPGLLYFTLPASVGALWLFHNVIKRPIVKLLPVAVQARLGGSCGAFAFGPARRFFAILGAIIFGIATHVVWDSFTHASTWPWHHIVWLQGWTWLPYFHVVPRFAALQYFSTLFGMFALAVWVGLWYRRTPPEHGEQEVAPTSRWRLAAVIFVVAGLLGFLRACLNFGFPPELIHADAFLLVFGVTSLALAFWQLFVYCVLVSTHQVWMLP